MPSLAIKGVSEQVASDIESAIEHYEGNHHDTLRFIATDGVDRENVSDVDITEISPQGVTFLLTTPEGQQPHKRGFGIEVSTIDEFNAALFALLMEARQATPEHPKTSIEEEFEKVATLSTWTGEVVKVETLTPNMLELTVGGLHSMPALGGDEFFSLMVPRTEDQDLPGAGMTWSEIQAIPEEDQPQMATYTTRRRRLGAGEIDIWVVLHGHEDGVAGWVSRATPGEAVALWGPRRSYEPPAATESHLLVCDETGLPAACAIIETLPDDHPVEMIIEAAGEDHIPPLPEHPGLTVRLADRGEADAGTSGALLEAIRQTELSTENLYAFGAAESKEISAVRKHLRHDLKMDAANVHMTGYWRRRAR